MHIQAGAGIVIDSLPEREYFESMNKAKALWKAIQYSEQWRALSALRQSASQLPKGERYMILVIDNYDSFTYNLVQYLGELGEDIVVNRNDEIDLEGIAALKPDHILISPGPCTPNEAGVSLALSNGSRARSRSSASAWDIRRSDKRSAATSFARSS